MSRIAISQAAFEAIARTLPLGSTDSFAGFVFDVFPPAARHGAKSGYGFPQAVSAERFKTVNAETDQGPGAIRFAHPSAGPVNADRLEHVPGEFAGRLAVGVDDFAVLQSDADGFVLAPDQDQYTGKMALLIERTIVGRLGTVASWERQQCGRSRSHC